MVKSNMSKIELKYTGDWPVVSEGGRRPSALSTGHGGTNSARPAIGALGPGQRWSVGDLVACVDGPLDAREKMRSLTGGSIAIMCSACRRGAMTAGPDGVRDPVPNTDAASQAVATSGFWIVGSTDRHLIQLFHPGINARFRRHRLLPVGRDARHRDPCQAGHLVVQSRPKPRGGSLPVMPQPPRW